MRQRLDDHVAIRVVVADAKDLAAAHAVERLENDVTVQVDKAADQRGFARHQRRHGKLGELQYRQLLGVIAQRLRPIEDARAFFLGTL